MLRSLLTALIALIVLVSAAFAQTSGLSTMGTDFYVPIIHSSDVCPQLEALRTRSVLVSAFCDTRFSLYYFDRKTGAERFAGSYLATATKAASVALNDSAMRSQAPLGEAAEWIACHIVAEHPVSVHAFSFGPVECYESMLLPTNLLGNDYVVSTAPTVGPYADRLCNPDTASSVIVILATADSTHVTITPSDYTLTNQHDGGKPFNVVLQRGQVYTVKSRHTLGATLDASRVTSDKPIVVWGGAEATSGDPSGITDPDEDLRNVIAQQMLPAKLWSRGPFYMAPLIDPPGITSGNQLSYYTGDSSTAWTHTDLQINFLTRPLSAHSYFAVGDVTSATLDSASRPIMMTLLDYRAENLNYPVATPTMMNVVPWTAAVRSATFDIPAAPKNAEGSAYVTLIVRTNPGFPQLRYFVDGADSGALTARIAEYRLGFDVRGWTYRLPAGHTYRITSDSAFVAYQSNFFGVALTGRVQHGGANSYFFSCATPVVGRFPILGSEKPQASASYNCDASWTITARGSSTAPLGLGSVLRDPLGDYIRVAADSGYASTNVAGTGPLFTPNVTTAQFCVAVLDPLRDADAYVQVQNTLGNDTVIHLHYTAPLLTQSMASVSFDNAAVGLDSCVRITYRNVGHDTLRITRLMHSDSTFDISASRSLPFALLANDSVAITVCHVGHVESRFDTLHVVLACGEARVPIHAVSAKTTMSANDYNFGGGVVGMTYNHRIALMNTGTANLLVSRAVRSGATQFTFTDSARLPHLLEPGASIELGFRYIPTSAGHDTAYFTWISNADGTKSVSRVTGHGLKGSIEWSDTLLALNTTSRATDTIWLRNPTGADGGVINVEDVRIAGTDSGDFRLVANQLGYEPIMSFPLAAADSVWFAVAFDPDRAKPAKLRRAAIVAYDNMQYAPSAELTGTVGASGVSTLRHDEITLECDGRSLRVNAPQESAHLDVYDLLGRAILTRELPAGPSITTLSPLATGTYIARLQTSSHVQSKAIQVSR